MNFLDDAAVPNGDDPAPEELFQVPSADVCRAELKDQKPGDGCSYLFESWRAVHGAGPDTLCSDSSAACPTRPFPLPERASSTGGFDFPTPEWQTLLSAPQADLQDWHNLLTVPHLGTDVSDIRGVPDVFGGPSSPEDKHAEAQDSQDSWLAAEPQRYRRSSEEASDTQTPGMPGFSPVVDPQSGLPYGYPPIHPAVSCHKRASRLEICREKKRNRTATGGVKIRYHMRQITAHMRPRLRGRFVKTSALEAARAASEAAQPEQQQVQIAAQLPPKPVQTSFFCRHCGSTVDLAIPETEHVWRHVCTNSSCGKIEYRNPVTVVGTIVEHEGKVLLCRRAIEPCKGRWTLPAGFQELGESAAQGAARETLEEANASTEGLVPFSYMSIPVIGQSYFLFRAKLAAPYTHSPGEESLETQLVDPLSEIPFDEIAFSSISVALRLYQEDLRSQRSRMHYGVIQKRPGSHPADPSAYQLLNHVTT
ncbi:hypothetical protein WJX73_008000 [Symbiochloris irregularis]|uniref:Nudix hydrolase domain-containing protein n=1 Tax=Symbiochloris irregularis TaxID=706552 RepID=A0AAW1PBX3_9CHLO